MEEPVLSTIDNLLHHLSITNSELKALPASNNASSEVSPQFWSKLKTAGQLISKRATSFCMMFGKPPYPSLRGSEVPCLELQVACQALCEILKSLPKSSGRTLWNRTYEMVSSITSALVSLVESVKPNHQTSKPLTTTGTVWEYCDQLSNLPEDNKSVVIEDLVKLTNLVSDALSELEELVKSTGESVEEVENDDGEQAEQQWTDEDKIFLTSCLGLTKSAKAVNKKLIEWLREAKADDENSICDLDDLQDISTQISPAVDDLICALYEGPANKASVLEEALKLRDALLKLLDRYKESRLFKHDDTEKLKFLQTAVEHNYGKLTA